MKISFRFSLYLILAMFLLNACAQKGPEQPPATPATPAAQQPAQPAPATPPAKQEASTAPVQPAPPAKSATAPAPATPQPAAPKPATTTPPAAPSALQSVPAQAAEKVAENKLQPAQKPAPAPAPAPAKATAKDVVILKAALGGVRFEHKQHAEIRKVACEKCHHPSRLEKPNAAPQQACSICHTAAATAPMKTKLQAAFHNSAATAGTCIDCHKAEAVTGKPAPVKCLDCHKKENK